MIIDITNEVYTNIKNTILEASVLPSYPSTTPTFPCITVEETSNITNMNTIATNGEIYNDIALEINIFSDSVNKITEAKNIRGKVDNILSGQYGMSRDFSGQTPNFLDTNIYRYTLRYSFTIDKNKKIYRR